jgi:ribonuclease P protein subunit RPR2
MVQIARERIDLLMKEADRAATAGRLDRADRYVDMARRVGMRYNVRVPTAYRRRFCRACYGYLMPGTTSRIRVKRGRVVTTCLRCGHVNRIPLAPRPSPERSAPAEDGG